MGRRRLARAFGVAVVSAWPLAGCTTYPESVSNAREVAALSPRTRFLGARALPDEDVHALGRLEHVENLSFQRGWGVCDAAITNRGLRELSLLELPALKVLTLGHNDNITDSGLVYVARLGPLEWLGLAGCDRITNAGLEHLADNLRCTGIGLSGCARITESGVRSLSRMAGLETIYLDGCPLITPGALERLRASMPNVHIRKTDEFWDGG